MLSWGRTVAASDRFGDGTPDFLRLDTAADREAFIQWFTFLAEVQYVRRDELPPEIVDCAALIRFAYREALRKHDSSWGNALRLPAVPPGAASVAKYSYPYTPLKAALFRIRPGPFSPSDLADGTFTEFADAKTLMRCNSHRVARSLEHARSADLLFFRQLDQRQPFHAMVVVGQSRLEPSREQWIVYHTGPSGRDKGEVRRPTFSQLLAHPNPQWRPVSGNPNFLGVYRWNILRDTV
jgi:uncharacterized protein YfaT (DUF1175 family)